MINSLLDINIDSLIISEFLYDKGYINDVEVILTNDSFTDISTILKKEYLEHELLNINKLEYTNQELDFLRKCGIKKDFLTHLKTIKFPDFIINDEIFEIKYTLPLYQSMIVNSFMKNFLDEFYNRLKYQNPYSYIQEGIGNNLEKYTFLQKNDYNFFDGNGNKFSNEWYNDVIGLYKPMKNFKGSSNLFHCFVNGFKPVLYNFEHIFNIKHILYPDDNDIDQWDFVLEDIKNVKNFTISFGNDHIDHLNEFGFSRASEIKNIHIENINILNDVVNWYNNHDLNLDDYRIYIDVDYNEIIEVPKLDNIYLNIKNLKSDLGNVDFLEIMFDVNEK